VRFNYDHRVMDGATVARALQSLERILTRTIVAELAAWK
jgi:pyruvate/2-oxoglutarate dehydrogenase complex dihydrolipoamide acyltransferase (E2) component